MRLEIARLVARMTQSELAERMNLSQTSVSLAETGARPFTAEEREAAERILGVPLDGGA